MGCIATTKDPVEIVILTVIIDFFSPNLVRNNIQNHSQRLFPVSLTIEIIYDQGLERRLSR